MIRYMLTIVSSIIVGVGLAVYMMPDDNYGHLFTVSAGLVHRQRALIEVLNMKGVLTASEARSVMQMRWQR